MSKIHTVNAKTLVQWIEGDEVDLVDVREPSEYVASHIEGAILAPVGNLQLGDISSSLRKNKRLVLYCKAGVRSYAGCQKLLSENVEEVWNLEGGIESWNALNWTNGS